MAFAISSRLAQIGSSGGNSGRGASARRRSISAGENAILKMRERVVAGSTSSPRPACDMAVRPELVEGRTGSMPGGSFPTKQALSVARERVHFEIDTVADVQMPQRGRDQRVRNKVHLEFSAPYRVHRHASSTHTHLALPLALQ